MLLQSLWNLGLGRSSILFTFNAKLKTFEPAIADGRPTGVSLPAAQSLITQFIHTGNTFLYLRSFAERTFASATSLPARVALATSASSILSALEAHLGQLSSTIATLVQLQHHFTKPRAILLHVARMVDATKHTKNNEQLASVLHHRLLELEDGDDDLRQISTRILSHVSLPTQEMLSEWIGMRREQEAMPVASRGSFVTVENEAAEDLPLEYIYHSELMPRFISPEDGNTIFEIGNSYRFLQTQHPDHPLVNMHKHDTMAPGFEWAFGWQDIEKVARKAKTFEEDLRRTLLSYSKGSHVTYRETQPQLDQPEKEDRADNLERYFANSIQNLDALPDQDPQSLPGEIQLLIADLLNKPDASSRALGAFAPPLSLASTLSFRPIIMAQAKLVNAATLRLFFRSHHLRHHLVLQRQYHLLGDGVFSSLLATALFDPNRESAERHKGQMRSGVHMGLQLGSRTAWPPASSELRLALRGVLSESYYSSALYQSSRKTGMQALINTNVSGRGTDDLPGHLNFAIRNLTESEQEKVLDPDALSALDFLRLQYVSPPPLHLIITTACLERYDTIFKFLLRLTRMLFVVSHLPRQYANVEARQFRHEAHHFVTVLATHVFQTGITEPWKDFDTFVAGVETRIDEEDAAGEYGTRITEGIASLREAHEKCLDTILHSLLLRKRQRKVMALVEEAFEYILLFAKMQNGSAVENEDVGDLHGKLKGKIRVFLSVCKSLTGKQGYGIREEQAMERLVLGMEMNDPGVLHVS